MLIFSSLVVTNTGRLLRCRRFHWPSRKLLSPWGCFDCILHPYSLSWDH